MSEPTPSASVTEAEEAMRDRIIERAGLDPNACDVDSADPVDHVVAGIRALAAAPRDAGREEDDILVAEQEIADAIERVSRAAQAFGLLLAEGADDSAVDQERQTLRGAIEAANASVSTAIHAARRGATP